MAYDPNQQDNAQQQNQQPQNQEMQPTTSSAPGAGPGSSTGKSAAPQANPTQPFQNLQAYLGANAPQTEDQANKIAGDLNNQYGQVTGDVNKAQTDFGTQVKGGYTQANPTLTNSAASDPGAFVGDQNNVKAFQNLYNDTYSGPSNFESTTPYGDLSKEVTGAASNATNFDTLPGMQTYFQGQNPNATQGGNTLDAVLLAGNPNAVSTIQNAAKPFAGLSDYLTNATNTADQGVTAAQKDAQGINQGLHDQFTGANGVIPTFESGVNNAVTQAQTQAQARNDAAKAALGNNPGNVSDQTLSDLGLTRDQYNVMTKEANFINSGGPDLKSGMQPNSSWPAQVDLSSLLGLQQQSPLAAITAGNTATGSDYTKAAALQQLTGMDLTSFLNPENAGQAGTALENLTTTNPNGKGNADLASIYGTAANIAGVKPVIPDQFTQPLPNTQPSAGTPDNRLANIPYTVDPVTGNKIY